MKRFNILRLFIRNGCNYCSSTIMIFLMDIYEEEKEKLINIIKL